MNKMILVLSTALSVFLLSGCGGETTTDGVVDTNIQPHKLNRVVDATTIGDMTMSVTNDKNSYNFLFSLTDNSKHSQIYIDTDKKRETGFTPWLEGGVGAEYLMEDGNLFRYKGSGGYDFDNSWELVSWGEDDITSRDIAFETLGNIDTFNVQGILLDSNWWWDSSSDVQEFVKEAVGNNTGEQVTRQELIEMIKNGEDYSQVDVSEITDMSELFFGKEVLFDITSWDVSNVTSMRNMFAYVRSFNQDISGWDVSSVKDMSYMFRVVQSFNQPIGNWDVSNVIYMTSMFFDAESFNQPIGSWDVSNVKYMSDMFSFTESFNQPIGNWDVSNVKYMSNMFLSSDIFNQDISGWDVSKVEKYNSFSSSCPLWETYLPSFGSVE